MMTSFQIKDFDIIADRLIYYIKTIGYCSASIRMYENHLTSLKAYLIEHDFRFFDSLSLDSYIKYLDNNGIQKKQTLGTRDKMRVANALMEFILTGSISFRTKRKKHMLSGPLGNEIIGYLSYDKQRNLSQDTIDAHRLYLSRLNEWLMGKGITSATQLTAPVLYEYIKSLALYGPGTQHCTLCAVRGFLRYLHKTGRLVLDLSVAIPKSSYKHHNKLPTTYTKEEIENLIDAVDRANPKGKRDYAIILLAARLGLRASDICGLSFGNIHWELNKISLIQRKTNKVIELPLLSEIGNAIIDYLKYGRPQSGSPYVFLHVNPRFQRLKEPTIHSIVSQYLQKAGINTDNKKHGPHSLRHSLVSRLLENKTPMPVISEVLGHSNTESTKSYLSIDIIALRHCALVVPPLNTDFYGGENHE